MQCHSRHHLQAEVLILPRLEEKLVDISAIDGIADFVQINLARQDGANGGWVTAANLL
jgi:hypothetical protein